jgi:hypothetical protein
MVPQVTHHGVAWTLSARRARTGRNRAAQLIPARRPPQATHGTYRRGVVAPGWGRYASGTVFGHGGDSVGG